MFYPIQYISQGESPEEHLNHISDVLKSGGKWIQLRLKNYSEIVVKKTALKAQNMCRQNHATFILNDYHEIAINIGADGVHVGLNDKTVSEVKENAPQNFIIGGTANCIADIVKHFEEGASYIGLGPYRYTETKKNLSPVLGINGYQRILSDLKSKGIHIPTVAIGGIQESDFNELEKVGVSGIAVSGLLTHSNQKKEIIEKINSLFSTSAQSE